jgi:2-hydroxy-3-oxopropionate reductase
MKIGFIGTGSIGNPMAMNLLQAGHSLFIHDINPRHIRT